MASNTLLFKNNFSQLKKRVETEHTSLSMALNFNTNRKPFFLFFGCTVNNYFSTTLKTFVGLSVFANYLSFILFSYDLSPAWNGGALTNYLSRPNKSYSKASNLGISKILIRVRKRIIICRPQV